MIPPAPSAQDRTLEGRVAKLEDDQQLTDSKVTDQYQTKVESGSKYRLRLSGIVLLNMFENRGNVDNQDFPEIAAPQGPIDSKSAFGGSLRQSQVELQGFGPDVAGAHTSAEIKFDFAGGFPETPMELLLDSRDCAPARFASIGPIPRSSPVRITCFSLPCSPLHSPRWQSRPSPTQAICGAGCRKFASSII